MGLAKIGIIGPLESGYLYLHNSLGKDTIILLFLMWKLRFREVGFPVYLQWVVELQMNLRSV